MSNKEPEEKLSSIITITIKNKKTLNDNDELLKIPDTKIEKLGELNYSVSETRINKDKYKLTIEFSKSVSISSDIKDLENEKYLSDNKIYLIRYPDDKKYEFQYCNTFFKIILKVSLETLNGKGNKNRNIKQEEYSASMESSKSIFYQVNTFDYTSLIVKKIGFRRKDETLQYLIDEIAKYNNDYNKDSKYHCFIFCTINKNAIGKIFPIDTKIRENTEFAFFYGKIIYPSGKGEGDGNIANIRCLISTPENDYPYVLPIYYDAQVSQIFKRIREIIKDCFTNNVEFLCIKLCFMDYQIRLNESDEISTLHDVASSLLYTFSNFENCEDLFLKVDLILSK